jgi:hypothetical protein
VNTLEHKLDWLVALEHIRRVIADYARAGDANNDPLALTALLAPDARWACAGFGEFHGRDVIVDELARIGRERVLWSLHYPVAPVIDVAEDLHSAHGFWWLWELARLRDAAGTTAHHWLGATYTADFVRAADGWKIQTLELDIKQIVPYSTHLPPGPPP